MPIFNYVEYKIPQGLLDTTQTPVRNPISTNLNRNNTSTSYEDLIRIKLFNDYMARQRGYAAIPYVNMYDVFTPESFKTDLRNRFMQVPQLKLGSHTGNIVSNQPQTKYNNIQSYDVDTTPLYSNNQEKKSYSIPSKETVSSKWKRLTGLDWSYAKKLGFSDGSYNANIKLLNALTQDEKNGTVDFINIVKQKYNDLQYKPENELTDADERRASLESAAKYNTYYSR